MRQETNKEIDLLLRRLSRRDGEAVRDAETQLDDRHLDADELSSYAQNVAPPKARARYTEHLAECSTCRRLATELSLALGPTTAAAPVETVSPASGLKRFLSSLLSPMVLRYAAPALGVIVVMVIGFVVLRQRDAGEVFTARLEPRNAQAPVPNSGSATQPLADGNQKAEGEQRGAKAPNAPQEPAQPRESGPGAGRGYTGTDESQPAGTADTAAAAPPAAPVALATPDIHKFTEKQVSELPLVRATPPATLSPKTNITTDSEANTKQEEAVKREAKQQAAKTAEVQAAASAKEQANEAPRDAAPRPAKSVAADRVEEDKAKSDTARPMVAGAARSATRRRADDAKDDAETRSVAGRKFRKQSGIWTDTAYDAGTRTVNMARGSEQFRALVADEPAIGTIAEQLDGEVIVVWKGRAYRIR